MPTPALPSRLLLIGLLMAGPPAIAQHQTGADVFGGEQAFGNFCASCHGATGDLIEGVDLGRAAFRQPYSDEELVAIVMNGIPDTPMPPTPGMSREQAVEIVDWLRSRSAQFDPAAGGDAERGRVLFAGKGQCFDCHRVQGEGSRLGPELSAIGLLRTPAELAASLLEPDAVVLPAHRTFALVTRAGEHVSGRLLNHDAFTVQMLDSDERLRSFDKADLVEQGFAPSPMPSLRGVFDEQELADLVQYLVSLRGVESR